jgi:large subunit ribosomal protein L30
MPAKSTGGAKKTAKKKAKKKTKKTATKRPATKKAAPKPEAAPAAKPATAPKTAAAAKPAAGARVRVRQVRSGIGRRVDFRRTLRALGIKHHQDEVVVTRNAAIEGMLRKVSHLVRVTPEE